MCDKGPNWYSAQLSTMDDVRRVLHQEFDLAIDDLLKEASPMFTGEMRIQIVLGPALARIVEETAALRAQLN